VRVARRIHRQDVALDLQDSSSRIALLFVCWREFSKKRKASCFAIRRTSGSGCAEDINEGNLSSFSPPRDLTQSPTGEPEGSTSCGRWKRSEYVPLAETEQYFAEALAKIALD